MTMFWNGWLVGIATTFTILAWSLDRLEFGLIFFGIPALVMTLVAFILDD